MRLERGLSARDQGWAPILSALNLNLTRLESLLVGVAAAGIFAMMMILVVDVFGRYLFNRPLSWSYDFISIYLMPLVIFLALSDSFRKNHHLSVDIIYNSLTPLAQRALRVLVSVIIAAVITPIAWLAYGQAANRYANDVVIAGSVLWPTWIPSLIVAVGSTLLVLRALLDVLALVSAMVARSDDIPGESPERHERATVFHKDPI